MATSSHSDLDIANPGIFGTIVGGLENVASGSLSVVAGGSGSIACGIISTVGGGSHNTASATYSTVGGGLNNQATEIFSSVLGGGNNNVIHASASAVGHDILTVTSSSLHVNNLVIQTGSLPTGDPGIAGMLWYDATSGSLKVSSL